MNLFNRTNTNSFSVHFLQRIKLVVITTNLTRAKVDTEKTEIIIIVIEITEITETETTIIEIDGV